MTRAELTLPGSSKSTAALRPCQSKACNGAERVPDGGIALSPNKWICAGCWTQKRRRLAR